MALPNTHHGAEYISSLLSGKKNLFFAGIGGVSMNSLAKISHLRGHKVSGYDRSPSEITHALEDMGITVYYESDAAHVLDCDALIYTVAMPETTPEYAYAKEHGIPLISRADFLGYIMTGYKHRLGISGTHGKSSTTGMVARVLSSAGCDPTVFNGAILKDSGSVDMIGGDDFFVFEACEYMDSFLDFNPTSAVVLNLELDHVDYFHSIEQIRDSFAKFMAITGEDGYAIINLDCENSVLAANNYVGKKITYSRVSDTADYYSANEAITDGYPEFDVVSQGEALAHVKLKVTGEHNISNALASFALCHVHGVDADKIACGLSAYDGIGRRMEKICKTSAGADVYTDYAHHPTEIATTLAGARGICKGKLHVVFQPHTFSHTAELFDDFVTSLSGCGADEITLCEIYPARETNIYGISSAMLSDKIVAANCKCHVAHDFSDAAEYADSVSGAGDMIIVMGAGDVIEVAKKFSEKYKK